MFLPVKYFESLKLPIFLFFALKERALVYSEEIVGNGLFENRNQGKWKLWKWKLWKMEIIENGNSGNTCYLLHVFSYFLQVAIVRSLSTSCNFYSHFLAF